MVAWGGTRSNGTPVALGGRYDPETDSWRAMATAGAPAANGDGRVVWTGSEVVAWDGPRSAARYYPDEDVWRPVTFDARAELGYPAVSAMGRLVTWTGHVSESPLVSVYDPSRDSWYAPPSHCGPSARRRPELLWVGDGVMLWGGVVDCSDAGVSSECERAELQRVFYLPADALLGNVRDEGACTCPPAPR